jgi:type III secretory pathway component EscU
VTVTRLKKIAPLQCGVVLGLLYGLLGLIFAILWLPVASTMGKLPGMGAASGVMMGAMAIIIFPLMYGVMGFLIAIVAAALYNLIAGWTGGVEVTLDTISVTGEPLESAVV